MSQPAPSLRADAVEPLSRPLWSRLFGRLLGPGFFRNVLIVMSGTAAAQAIGFAISPILSRLFLPEDFGIFGAFNSVALVIAAAATLEYTQALMLPKEESDAFHLLALSCLCALGIGALCGIACLVAPGPANRLLGTSGIWALALLPVFVVVAGFNSAFQAWCVRSKAFKRTSVSQVARSGTANGLSLGLGALNGGGPALVVSAIVADAVATTTLFRRVLPDALRLRGALQGSRLRALAREYIDFPCFSATQNLINTLSSNLPVLLLTHFYGLAVGGAYAFGIRILHAPMGLALRALRQVLFQKAAEMQQQGRPIAPLYRKAALGLFVAGAPPGALMIFWAPSIFAWVFGENWRVAGEFASSLTLWMLFVFCNLPAVLFARLIRIQRSVFVYDLALLAARIGALAIGGLYLPASQTVLLFSAVGAVMNVALILMVGRAVHRREKTNPSPPPAP